MKVRLNKIQPRRIFGQNIFSSKQQVPRLPNLDVSFIKMRSLQDDIFSLAVKLLKKCKIL